jgi:hypothetical protein
LSNDDGAWAEDEDLGDVSSFGHLNSTLRP